jgi:hypothetical protein
MGASLLLSEAANSTNTMQKTVPKPSPMASESADRPDSEQRQQVQTLQRAPDPQAEIPVSVSVPGLDWIPVQDLTEQNRPQSSPKQRTRGHSFNLVLSPGDLAYLIGVLEREVGYYSLNQEAGFHAHNFALRLRRLVSE